MNKPVKTSVISAIVLASLMWAYQPSKVTADDADNKPAEATTTLQGGVVQVDVTLNHLRDARLSVSRVRKAAANLFDEVTRQQVTMNYNPNMVGTTVISVPMPSLTGQLLPPRKKWVKASMDEIGPIITLFKEDVDDAIDTNRRTQVSDGTKSQLEPIRESAFKSVKESFDSYKKLEGLTAGPVFDNNEIAGTVKSLDQQMKELDGTLKKGIAILQKEAKSAKRNKTA